MVFVFVYYCTALKSNASHEKRLLLRCYFFLVGVNSADIYTLFLKDAPRISYDFPCFVASADIFFSAPSIVESTAVTVWAVALKDNEEIIIAAVK